MNRPEYIVVHHTAVSYDKNPAQFAATNAYHKSQGFPVSSLGFYVGYHYLIEKNGDIYHPRDDTDDGAHTSQDGVNFKSIAVCFTGNFDIEEPTLEQVQSALAVIESVQRKFNIPDNKVFPHRHWAPKTCWGSKMSDNVLPDLRARLISEWAKPAFKAAARFGFSSNNPKEIITTVRGRHALAKDPLLKGFLQDKDAPLNYEEYVTALYKAGRFQ